MKRILLNIILLSFTVFSWGQLPQTNLDIRWTSDYTNVGGKYYGIDSLTGVYNTNIEFIKCSPAQLSNITAGFVNAKDSTEIVLFEQDTVPITCLFWNYNYQDTLYFEMLEHTINSDSTENLSYRLASIAHYSISTDARGYFSGIEITGTMHTVCASGCDYSDGNTAITNAQINDTIIFKSGSYSGQLVNSKSLTLLAIGYVETSNSTISAYSITSANTKIIGFKISGLETATNTITSTNSINNFINNCIIEGAATYEYGSNIYTIFNNSIIKSNNTISGFVAHPIRLNECLVINTIGSGIYMLNSSGTSTIQYCKFISHDNNSIWARANGSEFIKFNEFKSYDDCEQSIYASAPTSGTNYVYIYGNNFYSYNNPLNGQVHSISGDSISIHHNNFFGGEYQTSPNIRTRNVNSEIYNNKLYALSDNTLANIYIYPPSATKFKTTIHNNFCSVRKSSYGIGVGSEGTGAGDNTADIDIYNNIVTSNGRGGSISHLIFVGHQENPRIYNNYCDSGGYGFVLKGTSTNYTSEKIYGNTIHNCNFGFRIKGVDSVNLFNNTIDSCIYGIHISYNDGVSTGYGQTLINNIISRCDDLIIITDAFSDVDTSNYNILYDGTLNGGNFYTWQSLGYDQNSYNTNPNFKSATQLWPVSPSNAIGKGVNLGDAYKTGLDITTSWPDNIVTKNQLGLWSIGAYVVPLQRAVTSNSKIILFNNKYLMQ